MRVVLDWFATGESPDSADQKILSDFLEFTASPHGRFDDSSISLLPGTRERLGLSPRCNQRLVLRALGMENWTFLFIVARILDEAQDVDNWSEPLILKFGEEARFQEESYDALLESEEEQG